MALGKAAIIALAGDTSKRVKEVGPVPAWDDMACIRRLSGDERDTWDLWQLDHAYDEEDAKAGKGKEGRLRADTKGIRAFLVCLGLCDEAGKRLFGDGEAPLVGTFDGEALDYLYDAIRTYNGIGKTAQEDLAKNSEPDPSADSGSDSPANSE